MSGGGVLTAGADSTIINSGYIEGFVALLGVNPVLTLLPGSVIVGQILLTPPDSSNTGSQTLNVGLGLNVDLTIQSGTPDIINSFGAPMVERSGKVIVVNPTSFASSDFFARNLVSALLNSVAQHADPIVSGTAANGHVRSGELIESTGVWMSGFGARSHLTGSQARVDMMDRTHGLAVGVDTELDFGRIGLFGGAAGTTIDIQYQPKSSEIDSIFAGTYWQREIGAYALNLGLITGMTDHRVARLVAKNDSSILVDDDPAPGEKGTGLEQGRSSFGGWFFTPSAKVSVPFQLLDNTMVGSFRAHYTGLFLDGYTETGLTHPLTVASRRSHHVGARAAVIVPKTWVSPRTGSITRAHLRLGAEGNMAVGNNTTQAEVLGQSLSFDGSIPDQIFALDGVGIEHTSADGQFSLSLSGEARSAFNKDLSYDFPWVSCEV